MKRRSGLKSATFPPTRLWFLRVPYRNFRKNIGKARVNSTAISPNSPDRLIRLIPRRRKIMSRCFRAWLCVVLLPACAWTQDAAPASPIPKVPAGVNFLSDVTYCKLPCGRALQLDIAQAMCFSNGI